MTHVVELEIKRFFKAYIEDEKGELTEEQAVEAAKQMFREDGLNGISEDEEMGVEADDLLGASYGYSIDD